MRYLLIPGVGAALAWVVWRRLPARQLERWLAGMPGRMRWYGCRRRLQVTIRQLMITVRKRPVMAA